MWDLPGPGLEPVSPALAGRFLTTEPPGKSVGIKFFTLSFSKVFIGIAPLTCMLNVDMWKFEVSQILFNIIGELILFD